MNLILTKEATINQFLEEASMAQYVAIDTEFEKHRSYFANLALVQVCFGSNNVYIFDPVSEDFYAEELSQILNNNDILKVFHACKQDSEALFRSKYKLEIVNAVDTQIMARMLGYGPQVGYSTLVQIHCNVNLDKALQYSRWLARPILHSMLQYAAADALHLLKVFHHLNALLTKESLLIAIEATKAEIKAGTKSRDRMRAWCKFLSQFGGSLTNEQKAVAKEMILDREKRAMEENKLSRFIITDLAIFEVAKAK